VKISPDLPITYLVTAGDATDVNFEIHKSHMVATAASAAQAGVSLIQIREKTLSARFLFELTCSIVAATRGTATRVLVNDRADIAFAAGADGVHLTADSLSADVIRDSFPRELFIGVSTHDVGELATAARSGANFAVFGPVFETPGKDSAKGIDALREACARVAPFPVLAIGGVDADNVDNVVSAGASGVAAIRALNDADSRRRLLTQLK
jgi:thiamine-phosphate pyrophosphorylase